MLPVSTIIPQKVDTEIPERKCRWSHAFAVSTCINCGDEIAVGDKIVLICVGYGKAPIYCDVCGLEMIEITKKNSRFNVDTEALSDTEPNWKNRMNKQVSRLRPHSNINSRPGMKFGKTSYSKKVEPHK